MKEDYKETCTINGNGLEEPIWDDLRKLCESIRSKELDEFDYYISENWEICHIKKL
jgi:hypothetical protein